MEERREEAAEVGEGKIMEKVMAAMEARLGPEVTAYATLLGVGEALLGIGMERSSGMQVAAVEVLARAQKERAERVRRFLDGLQVAGIQLPLEMVLEAQRLREMFR